MAGNKLISLYEDFSEMLDVMRFFSRLCLVISKGVYIRKKPPKSSLRALTKPELFLGFQKSQLYQKQFPSPKYHSKACSPDTSRKYWKSHGRTYCGGISSLVYRPERFKKASKLLGEKSNFSAVFGTHCLSSVRIMVPHQSCSLDILCPCSGLYLPRTQLPFSCNCLSTS